MRKPIIPVAVVAPASALVWWVVGYLPWLVNGAIEDVSGVDAYEIADRTIMLPLLTIELSLLVLGAVVGGACAGLLTLLADGRPATVLSASFAGVACAVLLTGIQSSTAIRDAAGSAYEADDAVISALLLTAAGATLLGWLFGAAAYFGRVPLGLAMAGLAGALPTWLNGLFPFDSALSRSETVLEATWYLGAALLAAGLVVIGVRPYVRLVAWPFAIALAWVVMPALTATGYLSVMLRPPAEVSDTLGPAWDVFKLAANPANSPTSWNIPFVVAIGLAAAISIRLAMRRGPSDEGSQPDAEDHSPVEPSNSSRTTSM